MRTSFFFFYFVTNKGNTLVDQRVAQQGRDKEKANDCAHIIVCVKNKTNRTCIHIFLHENSENV